MAQSIILQPRSKDRLSSTPTSPSPFDACPSNLVRQERTSRPGTAFAMRPPKTHLVSTRRQPWRPKDRFTWVNAHSFGNVYKMAVFCCCGDANSNRRPTEPTGILNLVIWSSLLANPTFVRVLPPSLRWSPARQTLDLLQCGSPLTATAASRRFRIQLLLIKLFRGSHALCQAAHPPSAVLPTSPVTRKRSTVRRRIVQTEDADIQPGGWIRWKNMSGRCIKIVVS
jgi:hypothetical protein